MGRNRFKPPLQIRALRALEEKGYIKEFCFKYDFTGNYEFSFWLTQQKIEGEEVATDFSKYKIRIKYKKTLAPKVFVEDPIIVKAKHRYGDYSLCLYHPNDFKWGDDKSIAFNLIPWTYMWLFYHEMWVKTGKWYGEEYQH
ncbi:MAG: hypothetical protein JXP36_10090 [Bacteroidales bacterium]|nr:hypothetical protein [Bacteroidales bacterium]